MWRSCEGLRLRRKCSMRSMRLRSSDGLRQQRQLCSLKASLGKGRRRRIGKQEEDGLWCSHLCHLRLCVMSHPQSEGWHRVAVVKARVVEAFLLLGGGIVCSICLIDGAGHDEGNTKILEVDGEHIRCHDNSRWLLLVSRSPRRGLFFVWTASEASHTEGVARIYRLSSRGPEQV